MGYSGTKWQYVPMFKWKKLTIDTREIGVFPMILRQKTNTQKGYGKAVQKPKEYDLQKADLGFSRSMC